MKLSSAVLSFAATVAAHGDHGHDQEPLAGPHEGLWYNTLPGDGGTQVSFSVGIP
jgi:agmatinase